jgi:cobalt-zinc-cadmium efflux system membrane fusion protein
VPLLTFALIVLTACGKQDPVVEAKAKPAEESEKNAVKLDAALQKEAGVVVETVAAKGLARTIRATARLTQDENATWHVGALTDGRIAEVLANVGDAVRADQVVARMHTHDIHESRAEFQKTQTELQRAISAEAHARRVRDRARRLLDLKAGSLADAEQADAALLNAQSAVENARTELERARVHLEEFLGVSAEEKHGPDEKHGSEDLVPVRAPRGGVVVARHVSVGSVVNPGSDLFDVSDLSRLWAIAEVQESAMSQLRVGMPARLFVNAYPEQPFASRIAKIGEALDPTTRMVKVRLELRNPGMRLRPEMYGTAEIETGSGETATMVPSEAVQDVHGASVVFVQAEPTKFVLRPVETGRSRDGAIEIRNGLQVGDRVAVKGVFILKSEFLKASLAEE